MGRGEGRGGGQSTVRIDLVSRAREQQPPAAPHHLCTQMALGWDLGVYSRDMGRGNCREGGDRARPEQRAAALRRAGQQSEEPRRRVAPRPLRTKKGETPVGGGCTVGTRVGATEGGGVIHLRAARRIRAEAKECAATRGAQHRRLRQRQDLVRGEGRGVST